MTFHFNSQSILAFHKTFSPARSRRRRSLASPRPSRRTPRRDIHREIASPCPPDGSEASSKPSPAVIKSSSPHRARQGCVRAPYRPISSRDVDATVARSRETDHSRDDSRARRPRPASKKRSRSPVSSRRVSVAAMGRARTRRSRASRGRRCGARSRDDACRFASSTRWSR